MVLRPPCDEKEHRCHGRADRDAASDNPHEGRGDGHGRGACACCHRDQDSETDGGRAIVEQAFGFDQKPEPRLHLHLLEGRQHRNRIRRRDQHTEEACASPAPSEQPMHPERYNSSSDRHPRKGKQSSHRQVDAEMTPFDFKRRLENQRRQKYCEDQAPTEWQLGSTRDKAERYAGRYQPDAVGKAQPPRDHGDKRGRQEYEPERGNREFVHSGLWLGGMGFGKQRPLPLTSALVDGAGCGHQRLNRPGLGRFCL